MKIISKKNIRLEHLLYLYIILCPILDIASFLFRQNYNISYSPATIIRPIIPVVLFTILFFKEKNKKNKIICFGIYAVYSIVHLYLFQLLHNESSYGNYKNELQYIINYSFLIINLYLFHQIGFEKSKLEKTVSVSLAIYVFSLFFSIITRTSSSTYIEGIGFKGYFESGNSLCMVLILEVIILLANINIKKWKQILLIIFAGLYLVIFSEMRTGLYGFGLTIGMFCLGKFYVGIREKIKLNKKQMVAIAIGTLIFIFLIIIFGSKTLERRKLLKQNEMNNIDIETNTQRYVTGDILEIYKKIKNGEISDNYMSEAERNAIVKLCEFSEKHKLSNVNLRTQQLIYNIYLVAEQKNIFTFLFGNGYKNQTGELVMEMEIPALICNFGLIGFVLYFGPILLILINGIRYLIIQRKVISFDSIMYIFGSLIAVILSSISGYVYFNFSSMTMAIILLVLLKVEEKNYNEKNCIWNNKFNNWWSRKSIS